MSNVMFRSATTLEQRTNGVVLPFILWLIALHVLTSAVDAAPTYNYTVSSPSAAPAPNQVLNSPVPVSVSAVGTDVVGPPQFPVTVTRTSSAVASASYGALHAGSNTSTNVGGVSPLGWLSNAQVSSSFNIDNITISGPPGSTPADIVQYSVNINASGSIGAGGSGSGILYAGSIVTVKYTTGSSLGGFGNSVVGSMSRGNFYGDTATGLFTGFPVGEPGNAAGVSPVNSARAGDAISIGMQLETLAFAEMRFAGGPAFIEAFSNFSAVGFPTSGPIFNFPPGWSANSTDGHILNNTFYAQPGDYNRDGTVDAADYIVWRKIDSTQVTYDIWKTHFGETAGGGAGAAIESPDAAVPEPSAVMLVIGAVLGLVLMRHGSMRSARRFSDCCTAIAVLSLCPLTAIAVTSSWTAGTGSFTSAANWNNGVPDTPDVALFDRGSGVTYSVTFSELHGTDVTNDRLLVGSNTVTFNPALALPADYYLANATTIEAHPGAGMPVRGVTIGAEANDTAAVLVSHLSILQAVAATLGHASGSSGTLTLNQNNDQFNVTGSNASDTELIIGRLGTGVLDVSVGADVNVNGALGNAALGKSAGSNGTAKISGSGSTFNVVGTLAVGDGGNGILNVTAGGDVVNTTALIGAASGSIGEVHIGGVGTTWTNSASLYVGFNGQGSLDIDGEARVTTATGYIGTHPNSTGVATVTGGGSMLTATGDLFIGNSGSGTLEVTNGGDVVVDDNSFIGTGDDTSGAVTIDGNGSTWTNSGGLVVGSEGSGTLMVSGGGVVESLNGLIGYNPGSMGDTTVDGSGSTWTHSGGLFVGGQGSGTLMVSGGGVVESGTGYVGYHPGSMGNTTVDGSGSTWMNSGGLGVGYQGSGMLTIQNDGAVEVAGQVDVGVDNVGVMSVDNATATVAGYFHIGGSNLGGDGDGTLNITGGGTVTSLNFCDVGRWVGSTGHVHVSGAGSTWHTGPLSVGEQANGTLVITGGAQVVSGVIEGTGSDIGRTTDAVGAVTVDGIGSQWSISESLMVGIDGSGTLTVSNGGIVAAPNVVVNSASALRGDGLVAGNVQNGGLVSPGLSAGALSINGDYAQTTAGKLLIELSATSYDQLVVTDSASLAGTLEINLVDGFVPSIGQSWIILTADDLDDVTDTFNTEMLPSVPNLAFDVIYNAQSVVLTVMSALPGDYNLDGSVDAADYVVWRKTDGTQAGFDLWRAHFGETAGGGAGAAVETPDAAVPEPIGALLLLTAMTAIVSDLRVTRRGRA